MKLPTRVLSATIVVGVGALLVGCTVSSQDRVEIELKVRGTTPVDVITTEGATIRLDDARLAFGPLTLCPGRQAGDLCETARLEWRESIVVDVLSERVQRAGFLDGVTGAARSWMYDLGITSLLTQKENIELDAARELGGHSLVLAGSATVDGVTVPFSIDLRAERQGEEGRGVALVRKGSTDAFELDVTDETSELLVSFDASSWVKQLPNASFVESKGCAVGVSVACDGQVESSCDEAGDVEATRDCASLGLICAPGVGCASEVVLSPSSLASQKVLQALVAGQRPTFELR